MVAPMPVPASRYQLPEAALASTPASFQSRSPTCAGAAVVAARDERRLGVGDLLEGGDHVLGAGDAGRVLAEPDHDEVVVHDVEALDAAALGDELFLRRLVVHEQHVAVAVLRILDGLAGADRDHAHLDAGLLREHRQAGA